MAGRAASLKLFADIEAKIDAETPEQAFEAMRLGQEPPLRQKFNRAGFTDLTLQDTVLDFVAAQEKSRRPVRQAAARVYQSLRSKLTAVDDGEVRQSMTAFLFAVDVAKAEREAATVNLDNAIHFSANPHLEALLTLNGLIGEASYLTSDVGDLADQGLSGVAPYLGPRPLNSL